MKKVVLKTLCGCYRVVEIHKMTDEIHVPLSLPNAYSYNGDLQALPTLSRRTFRFYEQYQVDGEMFYLFKEFKTT